MTNADVMVTILSEVTGRSVSDVGAVVRTAQLLSGADGFDTELSDGDAAALLSKLRAERSGILNWILAGVVRPGGGDRGAAG